MSESSDSCTVCEGTGVVTDWTGSGQWREDTLSIYSTIIVQTTRIWLF